MAIDRERLARRLMETFLGELDEHVRVLCRLLPSLADPGGPGHAEAVGDVFRAAHSLKGAARSVGVKPVEEACHHLEDTLGAIRDGGEAPDAERLGLMLAAAHAIEEAGQRLREQRDLSGSPLAALLPRLGAADPDPPPAEPAAPAVAEAPRRASPRTPTPPGLLRMGTDRIDAMIAHGGELVVARGQLDGRAEELAGLREQVGRLRVEWRGVDRALRGERPEAVLPRPAAAVARRLGGQLARVEATLERLATGAADDARQVHRAASRLEEEIRHARVLPFADACLGLDAVAQDAAAQGGKRVELVVSGGEIRLDRSIMEGIRDSLAHLIRNAVDHGIEPPETRLAAGKPATGRVSVSIGQQGDGVECAVADDGRGLDLEKLRAAVVRRGLAVPEDTSSLAMLAFLPGLSTAGTVTRLSGRGVGLDVVKSRLDALRGTIEVQTEPGRGTTFVLRWRLRLTMARVALLGFGVEVFAIPSAQIRTLRRVRPEDFLSLGGRPSLLHPGGPPIPVISLAEVLGGAAPSPPPRTAVVLAQGGRSAALLVEEAPTEGEVLVKGLGPRLRRLRAATGLTILPTGKVAPVLDVAYLIRRARDARLAPAALAPPPRRRRVLVVDDSITTRTLQQIILETAGHEVLVAADGREAWDLMAVHEVDALVSDVEMPRMDGFALAEAVRAVPRWARLPIVLFTSLAREADIARGAEVGADAYLVKGDADQRGLIETLQQLL